MTYHDVQVTFGQDGECAIREAVRVGVGDAIHQELAPLIAQHTRRMMVEHLVFSRDVLHSSPAVQVDCVRNALKLVDLIMKETET